MSTAPHRLSSLSFEERLALEPLLLAFDQAWHERLLEQQVAQLPPPGHPHRRRGLLELIKIDLEQQRKRGRLAKVEAYLHFYPELGSAETAPAELLLAEYQVRRQFGETVELADFARRFPQQADALRRLVAQASVPPSLPPSPHSDTVSERSRRSSIGAAARPSESLPEQFGPYRVLKKLGEGGMGAVYLVHNTALERREALKVSRLPEELSRRFFVEAQAAARTNHPNICQVYDFGEIGGVRYLTMECIEGGTLADLVRAGEPIPPERAAALVRSLALALEKTHEQKVYHRDLKPANVLLTKDGEPKITDFGLACLADESRHTLSGTIMGTPCYMAPEQAKGEVKTLDHACDIYSLGIILYELLTGRVPFLGQPLAVMHQHITAQPQPPSALRPGLDARLEAICLKALAKAPADRHASMQEFARELAGYSSAQPDEPVSRPDSSSRLPSEAARQTSQPAWRQRLPRWSYVAGFGGFAAALLGVVFLLQTEYGTIRIEVNDPKATVTVEIDGKKVTIKELGDPIRLKAGQHALTVKRGDLVVETREFRIARGDNTPLRVTLEKPPEIAQVAPIREVEKPMPTWVPLMNRNDLAGWRLEPANVTHLSIVEGTCFARGDAPPGYHTHLVTARKDYVDFRFRCQIQWKDNLGPIYIMARVDPSQITFGGMRGYEVAVTGTTPDGQGKQCGVTSLSLSSRVRTDYQLARATHDPLSLETWHWFEMLVTGNRIQVFLADKCVLDHRDVGRTFRSGALGFRFAERTSIHFRNLEIRELPSDPPTKPEGATRTRWVHQAVIKSRGDYERWGVFKHVEGKDWVETVTHLWEKNRRHGEFRRAHFIEATRTPEFIELHRLDGVGPKIIRLYNSHSDWGDSPNGLTRCYEGHWEQ